MKRKPPFAECTEIPESQREGRIIADSTVDCYSDSRLHIRKCGDILFLFPFFFFFWPKLTTSDILQIAFKIVLISSKPENV